MENSINPFLNPGCMGDISKDKEESVSSWSKCSTRPNAAQKSSKMRMKINVLWISNIRVVGDIKEEHVGVPLWCSGLRVWCCHCSSLGHCCGWGSIPGPGTFKCGAHSPPLNKGTFWWCKGKIKSEGMRSKGDAKSKNNECR